MPVPETLKIDFSVASSHADSYNKYRNFREIGTISSQLYTIGYEGSDVDTFIGRLKDNFINCLVDVREIPLSRKRGFSKSVLAERLKKEDIAYLHFKELGSPKPVRDRLKATKDYKTFFGKMDEYLSTKTQVIEEAYGHVTSQNCCLMCFEKTAAYCHRKIVAKKIKDRDGNGLQIKNI